MNGKTKILIVPVFSENSQPTANNSISLPHKENDVFYGLWSAKIFLIISHCK